MGTTQTFHPHPAPLPGIQESGQGDQALRWERPSPPGGQMSPMVVLRDGLLSLQV